MLPKLSNKQPLNKNASRWGDSSQGKQITSQSVSKNSSGIRNFHKHPIISPSMESSRIQTNRSQVKLVQGQLDTYKSKITTEIELNNKLKELYRNIQDNYMIKAEANEEEEELLKLVKQKKKIETMLQNSSHTLNLLISENSKLKEQVNKERNQRAIYFNIYKNLEHEIHTEQTKYKHLLIDSLIAEGAITKIRQKFKKASKKLVKEIQSLEQSLANKIKSSPKQIFPNHTQASVSESSSLKRTRSRAVTRLDIFLTENTNPDNNQKADGNGKQTETKEVEKCKDVQSMKYEIEMKNLIIKGIRERLVRIFGLQNDKITELIEMAKSIEQKISGSYDSYQMEEEREKLYDEQIAELHQKIQKSQSVRNNQFQIAPKTPDQNFRQQSKLEQHLKQMQNLEKQLSLKLGIEVSSLTNQMIMHYSLKVNEGAVATQSSGSPSMKKTVSSKGQGKKTLEKHLQGSLQDKTQFGGIMSPREMKEKILKMKLI